MWVREELTVYHACTERHFFLNIFVDLSECICGVHVYATVADFLSDRLRRNCQATCYTPVSHCVSLVEDVVETVNSRSMRTQPGGGMGWDWRG